MEEIAEYASEVLDALGVSWGPAHIEVMWSSSPGRGPVLIEANVGRFHGQDIVQISDRCYGYNSIAVTLDSYLSISDRREEESMNYRVEKNTTSLHSLTRWKKIPKVPRVLGNSGGRIVHLVSYVEGVSPSVCSK